MEVLGSDTLRAMLTVRICLGVEDPAELPLAFGLRPTDRGRWDPQLLDAPGKFYLQARAQAQTIPRPARAAWIPVEQVRQVAAHAARQPTPLDELSARAAAQHPPPTPPAAQPRGAGVPSPAEPTTDTSPFPPTPAWAGPRPDGSGAGGWPPPPDEATANREVNQLLAVVATTGRAGITVPELVAATGRGKTWVYDRLADLVHAGLVERCGQGRHRSATPW